MPFSPKPNGLAQAFVIGRDFVGTVTDVALVLGDNIFYGHGLPELLSFASACARTRRNRVFGYVVAPIPSATAS